MSEGTGAAWLGAVPRIDAALALAVGTAGLAALVGRRRGGRLRELPGWAGFWLGFAALLVLLSRGPRWLSFPVLAVAMFAALRTYFHVAPLRLRDRWAILTAYLMLPISVWPAYIGSKEMFLATVPVLLFLFVPVFLSVGRQEPGLLDAIGRMLLGMLFFVFCLAHLGLLAHEQPPGIVELFGVLVLAAELPQRLLVRSASGAGWSRRLLGVAASAILATALGGWAGPWIGLSQGDAARAGGLVFAAVSLGALVGGAVTRDLVPGAPTPRLGRGGLLHRMAPVVYAAPVFYHYLAFYAR